MWNVVVLKSGSERGNFKIEIFLSYVLSFFCRSAVLLAIAGTPGHCAVAPECFDDSGAGGCATALLEFCPYRLVEATLKEVEVADGGEQGPEVVEGVILNKGSGEFST